MAPRPSTAPPRPRQKPESPKKQKAPKALSRSASNPIRRRPSSATGLHPLTRRHNETAARSTGTLFEKHDDRVVKEGYACRCPSCRSPRGTWRNDELVCEVGLALQFWDPKEVENDAETNKSLSPTKRPQPARLRAGTLAQGTRFPSGGDESPLSDITPDLFRRDSNQTRPRTAPTEGYGRKEHILVVGDVPLLDLLTNQAPLLHQTQKTKRQIRTEAVIERKRLLQENFVERCRTAWDAKVATIENRQKPRVDIVSGQAATGLASKQRAEFGDRIGHWLSIIAAIRVLQGFQELAVSGRMLLLGGLGGASFEKQLTWGKATCDTEEGFKNSVFGVALARRKTKADQGRASPKVDQVARVPSKNGNLRVPSKVGRELWQQQETIARTAGPSVTEKLRRACYIGNVFPDLRKACMQPVNSEDWSQYVTVVQAATITRQHVWKMWSAPLICGMAVARLKCRAKRAKAGKIMTSVMIQMAITNNMYLAIKKRFVNIRQIQWAVKDWIKREAVRYDLISKFFNSIDTGMIRREWADADRKSIKDAQKKLLQIRCVKERKACERVIEMSKENYRRYMKPKSDTDLAHTESKLEKCRLPMLLRNLATYHAYTTRKVLIKHQLAEHEEHVEVYQRKMQMWNDIHQAVQIIDPSGFNPDPVPQAPVKVSFVFLLEEPLAVSIVTKIRCWYDGLRSSMNRRDALMLERLRSTDPSCPNFLDASVRALGGFEMKEFMKRMPRGHREGGLASSEVQSQLRSCQARASSEVAKIVREVLLPNEVFCRADSDNFGPQSASIQMLKDDFSEASDE